MTDSSDVLQHRIESADDLQAVVRTMKALSASNITQYEKAVEAVEVYANSVELGLIACLRQKEIHLSDQSINHSKQASTGIIILGSDLGLVGQFNRLLAQALSEKLTDFTDTLHVWVMGERMGDQIDGLGIEPEEVFKVPNSVDAITQFVEQILLVTESAFLEGEINQLHLFYNGTNPDIEGYEIECQRLLPLDHQWQQRLRSQPWGSNQLPETLGRPLHTFQSLIREYLFVSLYKACAESLASENASRLATMQRAEKNIGDMLADLTHCYHQLRQEKIDVELFDVISSFTS